MLFVFTVLFQSSWSFAENFVVANIRVEGLQRVSPEEAFANLPLQIGDSVDQRAIATATRSLFKSGYFEDIAIARDGNELIVRVKERPAIAGITLFGNKLVKKEQLEAALERARLVAGEIFQRSTLAQIELEIEREYNAIGRYAVAVNTEISELGENRVGLLVKISEGINSTISSINIIGNHSYDNDKLLSLMKLQMDNFWSLFTKSSQYSREKLMADLEAIRSFYLDRGHVLFNIESTQVSVSPDQAQVFITINVNEGPEYTVGEVSISGQAPVVEQKVRNLVDALKDKRFSRQKLISTAKEIEQLFGDAGFAFGSVQPIPLVNDDENSVDLQFMLRPGKRTYVRRINFSGNTKTTDEVLRREMRLMEGSQASASALQTSRLRIQRLGFFSNVNISTAPVLGTDDLLDVNVTVEEGLTASWTAKIGYTDGVGPFWGGSLTQRNLFGLGNSLELDFTKSTGADKFKFSYFDPYYTVDGVSRGFDIYSTNRDFTALSAGSYATNRVGAGYKVGYPLSENANISYELHYEKVNLTLAANPSTELQTFVNTEGSSYKQWLAKVTLTHNSFDDFWFPTIGDYHAASIETALPNSDLKYYRASYTYRYYTPLSAKGDYILSFRTQLGYANAYGATSQTPPYGHYFAGGYGTVRGFEHNSLGPKASNNTTLGGQVLTIATGELVVPFIDNQSVRTALFVDIGNTFEVGGFSAAQLRTSTGLNLSWLTPVGPLTFVLATPLKSSDGDKLTRSHITLGIAY